MYICVCDLRNAPLFFSLGNHARRPPAIIPVICRAEPLKRFALLGYIYIYIYMCVCVCVCVCVCGLARRAGCPTCRVNP